VGGTMRVLTTRGTPINVRACEWVVVRHRLGIWLHQVSRQAGIRHATGTVSPRFIEKPRTSRAASFSPRVHDDQSQGSGGPAWGACGTVRRRDRHVTPRYSGSPGMALTLHS
jgi:hypothetical protein